jgi:hypothetical protein
MRKTGPLAKLQARYEQHRRRLAKAGLISHGSVQDRSGRAGGGAGYQWTRKVAGKTVTVALTQEQYREMKTAIMNYRRLQSEIRKMEELSRAIIFQKLPHQTRLKRLPKKVLGTT